MPQGICSNCNRLIYDTEKLEELRDEMECQHCHFVNIIRAKLTPELTADTSASEELTESVVKVKKRKRARKRRKV